MLPWIIINCSDEAPEVGAIIVMFNGCPAFVSMIFCFALRLQLTVRLVSVLCGEYDRSVRRPTSVQQLFDSIRCSDSAHQCYVPNHTPIKMAGNLQITLNLFCIVPYERRVGYHTLLIIEIASIDKNRFVWRSGVHNGVWTEIR